jgi:hypothetical protein
MYLPAKRLQWLGNIIPVTYLSLLPYQLLRFFLATLRKCSDRKLDSGRRLHLPTPKGLICRDAVTFLLEGGSRRRMSDGVCQYRDLFGQS